MQMKDILPSDERVNYNTGRRLKLHEDPVKNNASEDINSIKIIQGGYLQ